MFIKPMLRHPKLFINKLIYRYNLNKHNIGKPYEIKYHKWANNYSFLYTEFKGINKNTTPAVIYL